jgi:cytoskeleton protein RodZ
MGRFGEKLKAEREARGVRLEDIAKQTRVSVRLLSAIESERFDLLPGGVFNVSFIRQYCRHVGLDEDTIVAEFNALAKPVELTIAETPATIDETALMHERGATLAENLTDYLRRYGRVTAGVCAAALIAVTIALSWPIGDSNPAPASPPVDSSVPSSRDERGAAGSTKEAEENALTPSTAEGATATENASAEANATAAGNERGSTVADPGPSAPEAALPEPTPTVTAETAQAVSLGAEAAKHLYVEISITAKVWIQAVADGERVFENIFEAGQTRSIAADDSVQLVVGNAGGLTVAVNGKTMPPIGPSGHVRRVVFTPGGMEIDRVEPNRPPDPNAASELFPGTRTASNLSAKDVPALAVVTPAR